MIPQQRTDAPGVVEAEQRESAFFDDQAYALEVESLPPDRYAPLHKRMEDSILEAVGPLDGANVLDLGCGIGDLTLRLLDRGANVTAIDVSGGALDLARRRVERFRPGAPVRFVETSIERSGLDDDSLDVVVGQWILHHLDLELALPEIRRLMKPEARGAFVETSGLNPLLMLARRRLVGRLGIPRYGTPDEHPITNEDLDVMRRLFSECVVDHPDFVLFYLMNRHLLKGRYARASRVLAKLDRTVERRAPWLGRASYYMRIRLRA